MENNSHLIGYLKIDSRFLTELAEGVTIIGSSTDEGSFSIPVQAIGVIKAYTPVFLPAIRVQLEEDDSPQHMSYPILEDIISNKLRSSKLLEDSLKPQKVGSFYFCDTDREISVYLMLGMLAFKKEDYSQLLPPEDIYTKPVVALLTEEFLDKTGEAWDYQVSLKMFLKVFSIKKGIEQLENPVKFVIIDDKID
jgi:hypothetical protein